MDLSSEQQRALERIADATRDFLFEFSRLGGGGVLRKLAGHLGQMHREVVKQAGSLEAGNRATAAFRCGMQDDYDFQPREDGTIRITEEEMVDPKAEAARKAYGKAMRHALKAQVEELYRLAEAAAVPGVFNPAMAAAIKRDREMSLKESKPSEPVAQVKEPCPKCKGTGNMGLLGYARCDACG